tara:strand:- start:5556 stop:7001 length:1446 start_codon:yes stop_codon:yes gene_type:complete
MNSKNESIMLSQQPVAAMMLNTNSPAFYVGSDNTRSGKSVVTVHAAKSVVSRQQMDALRLELAERGHTGAIKLRRHSDRSLERARSIEGFVKTFAHEQSLHDATGAIDRGHALVSFAREMRAELGDKLAGLYWNSRWRTAYVVLNHKHFIRDGKLSTADLGAMEDLTLKNLLDATSGLTEDFKPAMRLCFELPRLALVPIDARSQVARRSIFGIMRSNMMMPALGALIGMGSVGMASADETAPAVSGINGKVAIIGGYSDSDNDTDHNRGLFAGSLTLPGDKQWGVQFDGAIGRDGGEGTGGIGGHFFWRDPSKALLGVTLAHVKKQNSNGPDQSLTRLGGEGELYLDQFTVTARGGYQWGSNVDAGTYSGIDLSWYATDNLKFVAGGANDPVLDMSAHAGFEFQPGMASLSGLTFFADAAVADDSYVNASVGIRYYFGGGTKSLKDRNRLDDPVDNLALQGLDSISQDGNNYTAPYIGPV